MVLTLPRILIMKDETRAKILHYLVRFHFAYLITIPFLGLISWWFVRPSALAAVIIAGFAPIAAYYALQVERYHLTTHLPSALWVTISGPLLVLISSIRGGGVWFFFVDATFIEIGGMCAGIIAGATVKGIREREYFYPGVLYVFMGGFIAVWGWVIWQAHATFGWQNNLWLIAALANETYGYSRMFLSRDLDLYYGNTGAASRAGAGWMRGPLKDEGFALIVIFAVIIILSPFVIGLLKYAGKL